MRVEIFRYCCYKNPNQDRLSYMNYYAWQGFFLIQVTRRGLLGIRINHTKSSVDSIK